MPIEQLEEFRTKLPSLRIKLVHNADLLNQYLEKLTERCNPRPLPQQASGLSILVDSVYNFFTSVLPTPHLTFKDNLERLMRVPVTPGFSEGIEVIGQEYFAMTPNQRITLLNTLRYNPNFISVLDSDRRLAEIFLRTSVNADTELLEELYRNRLGQRFLAPQRDVAAAPILFRALNGIEEREARLLRDVLRLSRREPRPAGPRVVLEMPKVDGTNALNVHLGDDADWLQDFRCPITQKLIVGKAVQVRLSNGQIMYFDETALEKWFKTSPTNPTNREPLREKDIKSAPDYRTKVLDTIHAKIISKLISEGVTPEGARKSAAELLEQIKKEFQWAETPSMSLQSA